MDYIILFERDGEEVLVWPFTLNKEGDALAAMTAAITRLMTADPPMNMFKDPRITMRFRKAS